MDDPGEPIADGETITRFWVAYDGKQTTVFRKKLFTEDPVGTKTSKGLIRPSMDTYWLDDMTKFVWFLGSDLGGSLGLKREVNHEENLKAWQFGIVEEGTMYGLKTVTVSRRSVDKSAKAYSELTVTKDGEPLILDFVGWSSVDSNPGQGVPPEMHLRILEVGKHNEISYPSKGFYKSIGGGLDHHYTFEVTDIKHLGDDAFTADWTPEWPTGTNIIDEVSGRNVQIPYTAAEENLIRNYLVARKNPLGRGGKGFRILSLCISVLIAVFVAVFAIRHFQSRSVS